MAVDCLDVVHDPPQFGLVALAAWRERLKTGIVHVNDQPIADEPMAPFGGVGNSGYGKFGGQNGINSFALTRWVTIQQQGHPGYPF